MRIVVRVAGTGASAIPFNGPWRVKRAPVAWSASVSAPDWGILLQLLVATVPAMVLVYEALLTMAAAWFYGVLFLLIFYHVLANRTLHVVALVVGAVPVLMLFRPIFYHNSISVIFAGILGYIALYRPDELVHLFNDRLLRRFLIFGFVYWWISVLTTEQYSTNLRVFELVFGTCCVFLLSRYRRLLAGALLSIGATSLLIVLGLAKYGAERMGMAEIGPHSLGHPQQIGMAASLVMVLCLADSGRWLFLNQTAWWRYLVSAGAAVLLLLTTSRTSWSLALLGLAVLLFTRGQRRALVASLGVLTLVVIAVVASPRGSLVTKYAEKVLAPDRSLAQRTTGRSDMYEAFPELFWRSPVWGLGLGSSGDAYSSHGDVMVMHSLFLHIGVETGIIGLSVLIYLYASFFRRALRHLKITHEVVPIIGALSFLVDGLAHNSFNSLMGVFVGLAACDTSTFWFAHRPGAAGLLNPPLQNGRRLERRLLLPPAPMAPRTGAIKY